MVTRPETRRRASEHARWLASRGPMSPEPVEATVTPVTLDELTARQRELLALVAAGLTNQEIGRRVFLCERTVKHHLTGCYKRLGVVGRVQAARVFWQAQRGG